MLWVPYENFSENVRYWHFQKLWEYTILCFCNARNTLHKGVHCISTETTVLIYWKIGRILKIVKFLWPEMCSSLNTKRSSDYLNQWNSTCLFVTTIIELHSVQYLLLNIFQTEKNCHEKKSCKVTLVIWAMLQLKLHVSRLFVRDALQKKLKCYKMPSLTLTDEHISRTPSQHQHPINMTWFQYQN